MHILDEDKEMLVEGKYGGRDVLQPKEQFFARKLYLFWKTLFVQTKDEGNSFYHNINLRSKSKIIV